MNNCLNKANKQIKKNREYFKKNYSISDYKTHDFSFENYYDIEILEIIFFISKNIKYGKNKKDN